MSPPARKPSRPDGARRRARPALPARRGCAPDRRSRWRCRPGTTATRAAHHGPASDASAHRQLVTESTTPSSHHDDSPFPTRPPTLTTSPNTTACSPTSRSSSSSSSPSPPCLPPPHLRPSPHHAWAALPDLSGRSRKGRPARSGGRPFLESPGVMRVLEPEVGRRHGSLEGETTYGEPPTGTRSRTRRDARKPWPNLRRVRVNEMPRLTVMRLRLDPALLELRPLRGPGRELNELGSVALRAWRELPGE